MKQYVFEDGKVEICKGMSRQELKIEVMKHGKLISVSVVY